MAANIRFGPPAPPTIPARKQAFLTAQTNLLSQPLAPSRTWRDANDASNLPIPARLIEDALFTLNHMVQQHCRRVYAPQASRNVAEQISSAYTRDAERKAGGLEDTHGGIGKELDFTDESAIESLPTTWPVKKDAASDPTAAQQYRDTVTKLARLNQRRKQLQIDVQRLRQLQASITSLRTTGKDGDVTGIQENIITKNGPVEKELERMRFLLTRVSARVDRLKGVKQGEAAIDLEQLGQARKRDVDEFLADGNVFPS